MTPARLILTDGSGGVWLRSADTDSDGDGIQLHRQLPVWLRTLTR